MKIEPCPIGPSRWGALRGCRCATGVVAHVWHELEDLGRWSGDRRAALRCDRAPPFDRGGILLAALSVTADPHTFGGLLIDREEDRTLRAVGMLREMERK